MRTVELIKDLTNIQNPNLSMEWYVIPIEPVTFLVMDNTYHKHLTFGVCTFSKTTKILFPDYSREVALMSIDDSGGLMSDIEAVHRLIKLLLERLWFGDGKLFEDGFFEDGSFEI